MEDRRRRRRRRRRLLLHDRCGGADLGGVGVGLDANGGGDISRLNASGGGADLSVFGSSRIQAKDHDGSSGFGDNRKKQPRTVHRTAYPT